MTWTMDDVADLIRRHRAANGDDEYTGEWDAEIEAQDIADSQPSAVELFGAAGSL